jgi:hypothetical protein
VADGVTEPGIIERLENVVDGMHLECAHCVLIVSRDEDDSGHAVRADDLEYIEAVHTGHLHVEEYEVGPARDDGLDRRLARRALLDDRDVGLVLKGEADAVAGEWLVIHDDGAYRVRSCRLNHSDPPRRF